MPGFPDTFMPFMDEPAVARSADTNQLYGTLIRTLREITMETVEREPAWRRPGTRLSTGSTPPW
ncbi:MAG: hypothetical protein ABIS86_03065 [Streptosporangiaceae bacterium]